MDVALQNNVQLFCAGALDLFGQTFERNSGTLSQRGFAGFLLAVVGDAAGLVAIGDNYELIADFAAILPCREFRPGLTEAPQ